MRGWSPWLTGFSDAHTETSGATTEERKRVKEQEVEIRECTGRTEILRKASAFFAQAELDPTVCSAKSRSGVDCAV